MGNSFFSERIYAWKLPVSYKNIGMTSVFHLHLQWYLVKNDLKKFVHPLFFKLCYEEAEAIDFRPTENTFVQATLPTNKIT